MKNIGKLKYSNVSLENKMNTGSLKNPQITWFKDKVEVNLYDRKKNNNNFITYKYIT